MENATKALIIAAAILIAIVLISLGVFVLGQGTNLVQENSDLTPAEISAFNSKFEVYFGDKVSATRVKQLKKFVEQYNKTADKDKQINDENKGKDNKKGNFFHYYSSIELSKKYKIEGIYSNSGLLVGINLSEYIN